MKPIFSPFPSLYYMHRVLRMYIAVLYPPFHLPIYGHYVLPTQTKQLLSIPQPNKKTASISGSYFTWRSAVLNKQNFSPYVLIKIFIPFPVFQIVNQVKPLTPFLSPLLAFLIYLIKWSLLSHFVTSLIQLFLLVLIVIYISLFYLSIYSK